MHMKTYLMKDDKIVMEYGLMQCEVMDKELLPAILQDARIHINDDFNIHTEEIWDYERLIDFLMYFISPYPEFQSYQDRFQIEELIQKLAEKGYKDADGYWFKSEEEPEALKQVYMDLWNSV